MRIRKDYGLQSALSPTFGRQTGRGRKINFKILGNLVEQEKEGYALLRDQFGVILHQEKIILSKDNSYSILLPSNVSDGVYLLEIMTPSEIIASSFIKTH